MQAKDISTDAFIDAVLTVGAITSSRMTLRWDVQAVLAGHPELVGVYGVDRSEIEQAVPEKVMMAKAKKLMRQGVLEGCDCGCRGDYEVRPHVALDMGLIPAPGNTTGSEPPYGYWIKPEDEGRAAA